MSANGPLKFLIADYVKKAGKAGVTVSEVKKLLLDDGHIEISESITDNTIRETIKDMHTAYFGDPDNQVIQIREHRGTQRWYYLSIKDLNLLPACKNHVPKPPGEARN